MTVVSDYRAILGIHDSPEERWNGNTDLATPVIVTFSFADGANVPTSDESSYSVSSTSAFTSAQRANFRDVTQVFEDAAGIIFVEMEEGAMIDISNAHGSSFGGWASYAWSTETYTGDGVFVIDSSGNYDETTYGFQVMMHELGHSMGLSHPHDGAYTLTSSMDNQMQTVMTYNNTRPYTTQLGVLDFQALTHLYGDPQDTSDWSYGYNESAEMLTVTGGDGDDLINGVQGRNSLAGGAGDDVLLGREDDDLFRGNGGQDTIFGGDGSDELIGGNGADVLWGDWEAASSFAGDADTISGGGGADEIYGGAYSDKLSGGKGADAIYGGNYYDTISGGAGADSLFGGDHNDIIKGGAGKDVLNGDDGVDTIKGGAGKDTIDGGSYNDQLYGGNGNDSIDGNDGWDNIFGNAGNDRLFGGYGGDTLTGGDGDDVLDGGWDRDYLFGGKGADKLIGGEGNAELYGGKGTDKLFGGALTDTLDGGNSKDTLTGGDARDYFVFDDNSNHDRIKDFDLSEDLMDMRTASFGFADLKFVAKDNGNDTLVKVAGHQVSIYLDGINDADLGASWFIF